MTIRRKTLIRIAVVLLIGISSALGALFLLSQATSARPMLQGIDPDMEIHKSDSRDPVIAGEILAYTLVITNNGPDDATGVVVTDVLPTDVSFVSAVFSQGTCIELGGTVTCTLPNTLTNGTTTQGTVTVTVNSSARAILINTAGVSATEPDTDTTNNTAIETTSVDALASLSLTKTDDPDPVAIGGILTYTLVVDNDGPSDATDVTLIDTLPTGVTFVTATFSQGNCSESDGTVTCAIGTLTSSATAMGTIAVTVTDLLPHGAVFTNTAAVDSNESAPETTQVTTTVDPPLLELSKHDDPDPVPAGAPLTYTLAYSNTGDKDATSVVITDVLDSNVTYGSASPVPSSLTPPTYTWSIGTVSPLFRGEIEIHVTVNSGLSEGTLLTNAASIDCQELAPVSVSEGTEVISHGVATSVVLSPTADTISAGQSVAYTLAAYDGFGNDWDVTSSGNYTIASGAGGSWTANSYTSEAKGTWIVTGTYNSLEDTATLIVVNSPPIIDSVTHSTPAQEGSPVTVTVAASDPSNDPLTYSFDWDSNGSYEIIDQTPNQASNTWDDDGVYSVTVHVRDDDGGEVTDTLSVTVANVAPTASASNDGPVAENSPVTITVTATDPSPLDAFEYRFDCNNDSAFEIIWQSSPSAQCTFADDTGSPFTVQAQARDDDGASSNVATTFVTVNNVPPTANAGDDQTVDEGTTVNFSGSGSDPAGANDPLTYQWDFNYDGSTFEANASGQNASTSYADGPDSFTVALRVSDDDGGQTIDTLLVTVLNVPPSITTLSNNGPVDEASPAIIYVTGDDPGDDTISYAYDWNEDDDFNDPGESSNTYTWNDDGVHAITVQASDEDGGVTTDTTTITVLNVPPSITSLSNNGPVDEASPVIISVTASDPGNDSVSYAYDWNVDGDFDDPGETVNSYTWNNDGIYTITVRASDEDGGVTTDTTTIIVNNVAPSIDDVTHVIPVYEGSPVTITVTASDPGDDTLSYGFDWNNNGDFGDDGDIESQSSNQAAHIWDDNGGYTIRVVVYDDDTSTETVHSVAVNNVAPIVNAGEDQVANEAEVVSFTGVFTDPGTADIHNILWSFGDGATITNTLSPTHVYTDPGNFIVTLTITDDDGGVGSDTALVTANNLPPIAEAGGPYYGIAGMPVTLTASGSQDPGGGALTYTWDLDDDGEYDDATGDGVVYTWTVAGTHTVTVRAVDAQAAADTDSAQVSIDPAELDHIVLSPSTSSIFAWEAQTYTVEAFDVHNNSRGDVTSQTSFGIVEDGHGGYWTDNTYTPVYHGDWTVRAVHTGTRVTTDTASLTVLAPFLYLKKTANPDPVVEAGEYLTYTLTYSNTGNSSATGVVITDMLDPHVDYITASLIPTGGLPDSPFWSISDIGADESGQILITVAVVKPLTNGTVVTNTAWLDADWLGGGRMEPLSAAQQTIVHSRPVLTITKIGSPDPVTAGLTLRYTIVISNYGNENASTVTVIEDYDPNTHFVYAAPNPDPGSGNRQWTFPTLEVGTSKTINVVVQVDSPLSVGTVLTNQVTLDSDQTLPITQTEITSVTSVSELTVTKLDLPDPVEAGENLVYYISYGNFGTATAEDAVVRETYDNRISFVSALPSPEVGTDNVWNVGNLPVGTGGNIIVTVWVDTPLTNGTILTNQVTIDSVHTSPQGYTETTVVSSAPDLTFTIIDHPDPVIVGDFLTYTLRCTNEGNADATQVVITTTLDPNVAFVAASPMPTNIEDGTAYWQIGDISGEGGYAEIIVYTAVTLPLPNGTVLDFAAQLVDAERDSLERTAQTTVNAPILHLAKSDTPDPVQAGDLLNYTFTYTNTGDAVARDTIITDTLDTNVTLLSADPPALGSGQVRYWTIGDLPPNESHQIAVHVRVHSPLPNNTILTNTAAIESERTISTTAIETTTVHSAPILDLAKSDNPDPVQAGDLLTYTLAYSNIGNEIARNVVITEVLDPNTFYDGASVVPSVWVSDTLFYWNIGDLSPGPPSQITLRVAVTMPLTDGTVLTNTTLIDSRKTLAYSVIESTTVKSAPILSLSKIDGVSTAYAGDMLTYTLTYTNTGNENAYDIIITDTLPTYTEYVGCETQDGTCQPAQPNGDEVIFHVPAIVAHTGGQGQVTVRVIDPLPAGATSIVNNVKMVAPSLPAPIQAQDVDHVGTLPDLRIAAGAHTPSLFSPGNRMTYIVPYGNAGHRDAENVIITTTLPVSTTYVGSGWHSSDGRTYTHIVGDLSAGDWLQPNRVYANSGGSLVLAWSSPQAIDTKSVAWGDWDGDEDLDLVAGHWDEPSQVYAKTGGSLALAWFSPQTDTTTSIAWGDWNGDGDPDLAVGNLGQPNRVYTNTGNGLVLAWSSSDLDDTTSVAWGDWDGDSNPDLAVGNLGQPNRIYTNTGGGLTLAWSSPETDTTTSIAWGDWDGDGDLDLAVGNLGQPNRVYANTGGNLALAWSSPETDTTTSVAWGDWNGDGDPDLAVGNLGQPNRVYTNTSGSLALAWSSAETDDTTSVAWGNWDVGGDLDLAVGNLGQPNRVYTNTGGSLALAWSSPEMDNTASVAWGDWDGDGDLDLAVGNTRRTVTFTVEHLDVEHPSLPQPIAPEFNTPFTISSVGTEDADPADNTAYAFVGVPDLVVTGFTVEPFPPQPDEPVTFTIVVKNQGTGMAWNPDNQGGFYVDVYKAPVASYPYDRDGDIYAAPPVLAADETYTFTITHLEGFNAESLRQIQAFYVKVDNYHRSSYGLVPESDEMNNLGEPIILRPYRIYLPLIAK